METRGCGGKLIDEIIRKNIMIWGCISARGVTTYTIDGIMVNYVHNEILNKMSNKVPSRWECHIFICSRRKTVVNTMLS